MSEQDEQQSIIKAIVPDSEGVQKNSAHIERASFPPPDDDSDNNSESEG